MSDISGARLLCCSSREGGLRIVHPLSWSTAATLAIYGAHTP